MEQINVFLDNLFDFFWNLWSHYETIIWWITFNSVIKFIIIYFFIVWWAFVIWVLKDITNRTTNIFLQVISILIIIFLTPIFWLPIYLLIRPETTLFEKYYEDSELVEEEDIESDEVVWKTQININTCPNCNNFIEKDFIVCPYCTSKITKKCDICNKNLHLDWKICPYCGNNKKHEIKDNKEIKKIKIEKK